MQQNLIYELRQRQKAHDDEYHQDILVLGTVNRAKHLVLHFVKYISNIECSSDRTVLRKNLADIMICVLSMSNLLNLDLGTHLGCDDTLLKIIGKMAKACESLDHVEDFPSHKVIVEETNKLFSKIIKLTQENDFDIEEIISMRWEEIENKFHFSEHKKNVLRGRR